MLHLMPVVLLHTHLLLEVLEQCQSLALTLDGVTVGLLELHQLGLDLLQSLLWRLDRRGFCGVDDHCVHI
jgi:hypothetical protein